MLSRLGRIVSAPTRAVFRPGIDLLKSAWDEYSGRNAADRAQAFSAREAAKNREWQEHMANTARQREVADLKAAGLNPILAAGGQGAPTGSGAQGHSSQAQTQGAMLDVLSVIPQILLNLSSAKQASTGGDLNVARINTEGEHAGLLNAQSIDILSTLPGKLATQSAGIDQIEATIKSINATTQEKEQITENLKKQWEKLVEELSSAKSQAEIDRAVADFQTSWGGDVERWTNAIGLKGRDVTQMVSILGGLFKLFGKGPKKGTLGFELPNRR